NVTRQVIHHLDNLLRRLCDVSGVGKSQVVLDLLFDRDRGTSLGGRGLSGETLRIDLDTADAEEFLHAVAYCRIQRGAEKRTGGFGVKPRLRLIKLSRLFRGRAKRQKTDDVRTGKRWLGPVSHTGPVDLAVEIQGDIIVAHSRGGLQIKNRRSGHRVDEGDIAALQTVLGALKVNLAFDHVR